MDAEESELRFDKLSLLFDARLGTLAGWLNERGDMAAKDGDRVVDDVEETGVLLGDERLTEEKAIGLGAEEAAIGEVGSFDFGLMLGLPALEARDRAAAPPLLST